MTLIPALLRNSGRNHWVLGTLGWIYGKMGRAGEARAVHDELEARSRQEFVAPFWLATTAASSGQPDLALQLARRANVERDPLVLWGRIAPFWDGIRPLPGFAEIMKGVWG
jgi:hypothetical protein